MTQLREGRAGRGRQLASTMTTPTSTTTTSTSKGSNNEAELEPGGALRIHSIESAGGCGSKEAERQQQAARKSVDLVHQIRLIWRIREPS